MSSVVSATIAFIGFGEAGSALAGGLIAAGATVRAAYDILIEDPTTAPAMRDRAREIGIEASACSADAVAGADIVVSAVTSKQMRRAAETAAPHLKSGQVYLDINSASPAAKREVAAAIEAGGGAFVEAAVMDRVPPHGHAVPMLLAGPRAAWVADTLTPFGMNVTTIGDEIGNASSVKMVRSVFMKGFTAILLESLYAARKLNAEDAVLDSLQVTFPGMNWKEIADYYGPRLIRHAKRQSEEMLSVAETLEELGVEPITALASAKRLGWLGNMGLERELNELPKCYSEFLDLLIEQERS